MTMQRMVEVLEANGFEVSKKYQSLNEGYEFTIKKNGTALSAFFHYPAKEPSHVKDDLQTKFIKHIIEKFEQESKKSMKNIAFDISRDGPVGKLVIKDNVYDVCVKKVDSYCSPYDEKTVLEVETIGKYLLGPSELTRLAGSIASAAMVRGMNTTYNPTRKDSINDGKLQIKDVIFNPPATIVFWSDGSKTVVKAENEVYDPEKGLAMAIAKRALGNQGNYFDTFKKYVEPYKKKEEELQEGLKNLIKRANNGEIKHVTALPFRIWYKSEDGTKSVYDKEYIKEGNAIRVAKKIFAGTSTEWLISKADPFENGVWDIAYGSDNS